MRVKFIVGCLGLMAITACGEANKVYEKLLAVELTEDQIIAAPSFNIADDRTELEQVKKMFTNGEQNTIANVEKQSDAEVAHATNQQLNFDNLWQTVLFKPQSAEIDSTNLTALIAALRQIPAYAKFKIITHGGGAGMHDNSIIEQYRLGLKRAEVMTDLLKQNGISEKNIVVAPNEYVGTLPDVSVGEYYINLGE